MEPRELLTTSETGKKNNGFTLLEVLIAFAVLVSVLVLVAALFSRHLAVLDRLEQSLLASHWNERQVIQAIVRRQSGDLLPAQGKEGPLSWSLSLQELPLEGHPATELRMQRLTAQVSWFSRNQAHSQSITTAVPPNQDES